MSQPAVAGRGDGDLAGERRPVIEKARTEDIWIGVTSSYVRVHCVHAGGAKSSKDDYARCGALQSCTRTVRGVWVGVQEPEGAEPPRTT